jgi:hypothetical protein
MANSRTQLQSPYDIVAKMTQKLMYLNTPVLNSLRFKLRTRVKHNALNRSMEGKTKTKLSITTQTSAQDIIVRNLYYKAVKLISTVNKTGREKRIPKRFIVFDARVPLNLHRHLNIILFVEKSSHQGNKAFEQARERISLHKLTYFRIRN